jgi:signal transduction histidine kinase
LNKIILIERAILQLTKNLILIIIIIVVVIIIIIIIIAGNLVDNRLAKLVLLKSRTSATLKTCVPISNDKRRRRHEQLP